MFELAQMDGNLCVVESPTDPRFEWGIPDGSDSDPATWRGIRDQFEELREREDSLPKFSRLMALGRYKGVDGTGIWSFHRRGSSIVVMDNVRRRLDASSLCVALTSSTVADRAFRTFEKMTLPVRCTWIATGNNVQVGGDLPRRCYWIRLDAKQSRPFQRTGFRHADLPTWVLERRGDLIAALLVLARYWYCNGQMSPKLVKPMGSFEAWRTTIGGILETAGIEGFLSNTDVKFHQTDAESVQWESFLLALADAFGNEPFRVAAIADKLFARDEAPSPEAKRIREALPDFLAEAVDRLDGFFQRRLGKCFSARVDRRHGERQVCVCRAGPDPKTKVERWIVMKRE